MPSADSLTSPAEAQRSSEDLNRSDACDVLSHNQSNESAENANMTPAGVPKVTTTQTITLSVFRFEGTFSRLWAFSQMGLARRRLRSIPGIGFLKLFGSGSGASFNPRPNFGVYAVFAAWPSLEHAQKHIAESTIFDAYRQKSAENCTLYLRAYQASGRWDGAQPFEVQKRATPPHPFAVLTRATVRPRKLRQFWSSVPDVSDALCDQGQALFWLGLGEIPLMHQVTLSIWPDVESMNDFAYRSGFHREAIRKAKSGAWFSEDLFARFAILASEGRFMGKPLTYG